VGLHADDLIGTVTLDHELGVADADRVVRLIKPGKSGIALVGVVVEFVVQVVGNRLGVLAGVDALVVAGLCAVDRVGILLLDLLSWTHIDVGARADAVDVAGSDQEVKGGVRGGRQSSHREHSECGHRGFQ